MAVSTLSGGNQQKLILARELETDPKLLIAAQPTRGLDVGAIEFVWSQILEQKEAGRAVLLISAELDEIYALSDRIVTLYEGRITGEYAPDAAPEDIGVGHARRTPTTRGDRLMATDRAARADRRTQDALRVARAARSGRRSRCSARSRSRSLLGRAPDHRATARARRTCTARS